MVWFGWSSFNGKYLKFLFCKSVHISCWVAFSWYSLQNFVSQLSENLKVLHLGKVSLCVKALGCGAAAVLVIFHILLLRCAWFDETGHFELDYCCSAVNLLCSEAIINFST